MMLQVFFVLALLRAAVAQNACPDGWLTYQQSCYKVFSDPKDWNEARTACNAFTADLAILTTAAEQQWMSQQLPNDGGQYWIGLHDILGETTFVWADGTPFNTAVNMWNDGEPNNAHSTGEDCVEMFVRSNVGKWNDLACTTAKPYVCERFSGLVDACDTANGWELYNDRCYKFSGSQKETWLDAQSICRSYGGDLVSIIDDAENNFVMSKALTIQEAIYIGLSDTASPNQVQWSGGGPPASFTNWGPNVQGSDGNWAFPGAVCVQLYPNGGKWSPIRCRNERAFLCEKGKQRSCPAGWRNNNGYCYQFNINPKMTWPDARHYCESHGAMLLTIHSQDEQNFVQTLFPTLLAGGIQDLWLGISDVADDGHFDWVDGSNETYSNWFPNNPTDTTGSWDCSRLYTGSDQGQWETASCFNMHGFTCKIPDGETLLSGSCYQPMGMESGYIPNESITASSTSDPSLAAWRGRLNTQDGVNGGLGSWSAQTDDQNQWLQVDLGRMSTISGVITQGRNGYTGQGGGQWVTSYKLRISSDGQTFTTIMDTTTMQEKIFAANNDRDTEVTNLLDAPVVTRYVRFWPQTWTNHISMRAEILGCDNSGQFMRCPDRWSLFQGNCYYFEKQEATWNDADAFCRQQGANLASITSGAEQSYIRSHMNTQQFIGFTDRDVEGTFTWTDGSLITFLSWNPNEPNNVGEEDCTVLLVPSGKWNDVPCDGNARRDYTCKKPAEIGAPPVIPTTIGWTSGKCPPGWDEDPMSDYCYQVNVASFRTWHHARENCQNKGGDLASITTPQEQAYLNGRLSGVNGVTGVWIGAHDRGTEGGWEWSDGQPFTYLNWGGGEPNNAGSGEDCTEMLVSNALWNDMPCDALRGYMCKRRGDVPTMPPPSDGSTDATFTYHLCERYQFDLNCNDDEVIEIIDANYGRTSQTICADSPISVTNCLQDTSADVVRAICDGQQTCTLQATNTAFGDPCPGTYKYLEVTYRCVRQACLQPLGMENGDIHDSQLAASGSWNYQHGPERARLHQGQGGGGAGAWCAGTNDPNQWIEVDFLNPTSVTGIQTQGRADYDQWVTTFRIQYSDDRSTWNTYGDGDGTDFAGNSDRNTVVTNMFPNPILTRWLRVNPRTWSGHVSLRMEIMGCDPGELVTCSTRADYKDDMRYQVYCPPGCVSNYHFLWGTGIYTDDSYICVAALHDGRITNEHGGRVTVIKSDGLTSYQGSTQNGVTSSSYGDWTSHFSFAFDMGQLRCPLGWSPYGSNCYKVMTDAASWYEGSTTCRSMNAELVSIADFNENYFVTSLIAGAATRQVWIGLNDQAIQNYFQWSDGSRNTYTNWNVLEPNNWAGHGNGQLEDCVSIFVADDGRPDDPTYSEHAGQWNDELCINTMPYICEAPKQLLTPPTVEPTIQGCERGWLGYMNRCYLISENDETWQNARLFCQNKGGELLHVRDRFEQSFIGAQLGQLSGFFWIGLSATVDASTGATNYVWANNMPFTYDNWDLFQPDDAQGSCVAMNAGMGGSLWDDQSCDSQNKFVCEVERIGVTRHPSLVQTTISTDPCAAGWVGQPGTNNCYQINTPNQFNVMSWEEALANCQSKGADLASIHSSEESTFLLTQMNDAFAQYWIGLNDKSVENGFTWTDGSPVGFTLWNDGEPNNAGDGEHCVEMVANSGTAHWNDMDCSASRNWVCKIRRGVQPIPVTTIAPVTYSYCDGDPNWVSYGGSCYHFNDTNLMGWLPARQTCLLLGADLTSITSPDEQDFIFRNIFQSRINTFWLGIREYGVNQIYSWSDNSPYVYLNWNDGEPNDSFGEEQCGQIYKGTGSWNDANCGSPNGFICKRPAVPLTVPPPTDPWKGSCPPGWIDYGGNKCYWVENNNKMNWTAARSFCQSQGQYANLVAINDEFEQAFLTAQLWPYSVRQDNLWIGMSEQVNQHMFLWTSGHPVTYTNWVNGEPNDWMSNVEECVEMYVLEDNVGQWNDEACGKDRGFICQTYKAETTCPTGWIAYQQSCYQVFEDFKDWNSARTACGAYMADLTSITTTAEQQFMTQLIPNNGGQYWIGLHDIPSETNFVWVDGTPYSLALSMWNPGEPNNAHATGEDCAEMFVQDNVGKWNDLDCATAKKYVCERSPETIATQSPVNPCAIPGFMPWRNSCYQLMRTPLEGWSQAREGCRSMRSRLASVVDVYEENFLKAAVKGKAWIGLSDMDSPGVYRWDDSWPVLYTRWGENEPSREANEGCVAMEFDGRWDDIQCATKLPYLCKTTSDMAPPTPYPIPGHCPDTSWFSIGNSCFYMEQGEDPAKQVTWYEAVFECQNRGGELASIHAETEIRGFVHRGLRYNVWIGMYRDRYQSFVWNDGSAIGYVNWAKDEPNNNNNGGGDPTDTVQENCVEMYRDGKWNDKECFAQRGYVCKTPIIPTLITCPDGWLAYHQSCYLVVEDPKDWRSARTACGAYMADLTSITTRAEQLFMSQVLPNNGGQYWIGLHDIPGEMNFEWVDNTPFDSTVTMWNPGEPNNAHATGEDCVEMFVRGKVGKWNDLDCATAKPYVCEQSPGSSGFPISGTTTTTRTPNTQSTRTPPTRTPTPVRPVTGTQRPPVVFTGDGNISPQKQSGGGLDTGSTVAILLAVVVVLALGIAIGWFVVRRRAGSPPLLKSMDSGGSVGFDNALYSSGTDVVTMANMGGDTSA